MAITSDLFLINSVPRISCYIEMISLKKLPKNSPYHKYNVIHNTDKTITELKAYNAHYLCI